MRSRSQPARGVNARQLLPLMAHISRHGGVAAPELIEVAAQAGLPMSRPTLFRLIADAELHLGVRIIWRRDHTLPSGGEFSIEDWGVLDAKRVLVTYPRVRGSRPHGRTKS